MASVLPLVRISYVLLEAIIPAALWIHFPLKALLSAAMGWAPCAAFLWPFIKHILVELYFCLQVKQKNPSLYLPQSIDPRKCTATYALPVKVS